MPVSCILLPNNFLPKWKPPPVIPLFKIQWPSSALMIKVRSHVKTCRKPASHSTALAVSKHHVTPLWHLCDSTHPDPCTWNALYLVLYIFQNLAEVSPSLGWLYWPSVRGKGSFLSASILLFPTSLQAFAKLLIHQALTPDMWTLLEGMTPVLFNPVFRLCSRACHPIGTQSLSAVEMIEKVYLVPDSTT